LPDRDFPTLQRICLAECALQDLAGEPANSSINFDTLKTQQSSASRQSIHPTLSAPGSQITANDCRSPQKASRNFLFLNCLRAAAKVLILFVDPPLTICYCLSQGRLEHALQIEHEGSPKMETAGSVRIGDRVSFTIADVFLPEPSEVLAKLTADVKTEGVVIEFSDSGSVPRAYAMVQITAQQAVLLPVNKLHVLNCD